MAIFWHFWPKNPQFWIFPWVTLLTHASRHLEEDFRKFSAKTNDKNWSYHSKTFKKLYFSKNGHFLTVFGQKNPQFWIFPQVPLLAHASRHLREDFRKFSAKTNDKIKVISQKPSKNWIFGKKWPFFDTFWPKKSPILNFPTGTTTRTR